jgi:hypothetical protein
MNMPGVMMVVARLNHAKCYNITHLHIPGFLTPSFRGEIPPGCIAIAHPARHCGLGWGLSRKWPGSSE